MSPHIYRCRNVREPVLFQKAIDAIFAGDNVPDVVLEIGPHQTLVSPIKQVCVRSIRCRVCLPWLSLRVLVVVYVHR